jgi:pantoate--beta-alanine ligase
MLIFTKIAELQGYLSQIKAQNKTIGFVPTMGALHMGHISLIDASKSLCDYTICSIFVNPTQFNDKSDLERYPRMPEKDAKLLEKAYCDALFLPAVNEIYDGTESLKFDFGALDKILEGEHRQGHFNGVAQVVKRFFEIVQPHKAFFGSKDYQQLLIVKALVKQMGSDIEIIPCSILREPDGLAMSSRNALLSPEERKVSAIIPKLMQKAKQIAVTDGVPAAKKYITREVSSEPLMKLDYYEICDAGSLKIVSEIQPSIKLISLIALFVGKIRLIDNLILN